MLAQAQAAMANAQNLESELAQTRIDVDRGPVKAMFNGTGELMALKIDPTIVDPEDVDALEDLIVGVIREGFAQSTELRNARVSQILPNMPFDLGGK